MATFTWPGLQPPAAAIKPVKRVWHGDTVTDDYYWMIDYFRQGPDSEEVIRYLEAENAYLSEMMAGTTALQAKLYTELKSRVKEKDESVPVFKNGYFYYSRTEEGRQYFKYCRKQGTLDAPEEILLDLDEMAEGSAYFQATGFTISPDNRLLAYGLDTVSRRQYTIRIKDLSTGAELEDSIPDTEGDPVWAADSQTLFYTAKHPVTLLSEKICRHRLGQPAAADAVVYTEPDKSNYIGVEKSKSGQYILIRSSATQSSVVLLIDARQPEAAFQVFQPRIKDVLYSVIPLEDKFLILTNLEAHNFRLMECPPEATAVANWKEVIPHRETVLLEDVAEFKDFLVLSERSGGLAGFRVMPRRAEAYDIDFAEPAYTAIAGANPDYHSTKMRYTYTSMTTPVTIYDYDLESRTKTCLKQQEIPGGYQAEDYRTERLYATAQDGTAIPVSLVYKKELRKPGGSPLLLYAYGSYGHSMDAAFSSSRLSLLDRGFIFAIAHIRGGQEMGRQWYDDGRLMKKMNTFTDFIDCAGFLISQGYTSPAHLYAQGGSAGGLLMGAVINLAPELWNGVIAQVPFVDVVNTMLDESIPLTTNEFDEWGNPKEPAAYAYMKSYSPYENIEKKAYPNMLVTTGLHDSQVQYFEPAKWVAKLRANKTGQQVLLLKTDMDYGHGGASGRFDYLKEIALNYAFLFSLEHISE